MAVHSGEEGERFMAQRVRAWKAKAAVQSHAGWVEGYGVESGRLQGKRW